jgi:hypothetical protein
MDPDRDPSGYVSLAAPDQAIKVICDRVLDRR